MHKRLQILALIVTGFFGAGEALADGTHSVKIGFESQLKAKTEITVHNGKDGKLLVPHKVYYIDGDGSRTLKCHGQGKHQCYVRVSLTGWGIVLYADYVKDNQDCVLSGTTKDPVFTCE